MITTAVFPNRYIQGFKAIENCLGQELVRLGKKALLLESPSAHKNLSGAIDTSLKGNIEFIVDIFNRECSDEEIARIIQIVKIEHIDIIVGIGGGKTIDTAKAVAGTLNFPCVVVPTLASTDAPCSALSVIYTPTGEFERYFLLSRNPDLVLVDSDVVAKAPVRFLVAGMGDALATWFEAEDCRQSRAGNMTGRPGPISAFALARFCFDVLLKYGVQAKKACEQKIVTPALEHVIEANTLLSGLGFESGGLSAAHAIHNGFTVLEATHDYWHGEKVAIGTLAMLMLIDSDPDMIETVYNFCESVGLPTTLAEIGLANVSDKDLMKVAILACAENESIHNSLAEINPNTVFAAIKAANAEGLRRK
ncbi:glycerol dehydrogenase [Gilliamella sp. Occ3-1]|uniref:glycerol dehydrogenase n=1 Tax=Gilliamella sp. Occ3-1 TaxID=3120253 RepID=UPI00080DD4B4|nr:glycerol dehydrogenase [Gilliamella apicola]OCG71696.1 glycerol dehydrogenase [Gilliamella apicola]